MAQFSDEDEAEVPIESATLATKSSSGANTLADPPFVAVGSKKSTSSSDASASASTPAVALSLGERLMAQFKQIKTASEQQNVQKQKEERISDEPIRKIPSIYSQTLYMCR
jgi:hypothetical protein